MVGARLGPRADLGSGRAAAQLHSARWRTGLETAVSSRTEGGGVPPFPGNCCEETGKKEMIRAPLNYPVEKRTY